MFQALMGLTAAISLIAAALIFYRYAKTKELANIFVGVGLVVLAVLAALLAAQGLGVLQLPLAAPLGALVPLMISLGVVKLVWPKWWKWYGLFVVIGLAAIIAARPAVPAIHAVAGLVIFLLPLYAVIKKICNIHFIGVTIGGALIGVGGMALASAAMARPILPLELVVALLPWILLLMVVFYAYGFLMGAKK